MREAIGGTWLLQIVIFFILFFTGYICLSINQSKAYNVKDSIVKAIERENGINTNSQLSNGIGDDALESIVDYLKSVSYRTSGKCPDPIKVNNDTISYVGYNRDGRIDNNNASFCIAKVDTSNYAPGSYNELPSMAYYKVAVFYQLDIPIFSSLLGFYHTADTKIISTEKK